MIISGFPGIGKSSIYNTNKIDFSNSDSSKFDKKDFPNNYINHIKKMIKNKHLVLISSHIEVRNQLVKERIPFIYVIPSLDRKEDFLYNYKQRGSSEEFIENVKNNWEQWLQISAMNNEYPVYVCKLGYLMDNMEGIIKEYNRFYGVK